MRLVALEVDDFGCIERARVQLAAGLNVLYGPNDLGKSTLAHALRAALLLQPRQAEHEQFRPWHGDHTPRVRVDLVADDGRTYRIEKTFGAGTRGSASLAWSNDGRDFFPQAQGREVEEKIRELLGWGLPGVGGRGPRGLPSSFLSTVLLGRQPQPGTVFEHDLGKDLSERGRERLTEALQAFAQDPVFKAVLEHAQQEVDRAFTQGGKASTKKDSPFRKVRDRIQQLSNDLRALEEREHDSEDVRTRLHELDARRDRAAMQRQEATTRVQQVREDLERAHQRRRVADRLAEAELAWTTIRERIEALARLRDELHDQEADRPGADAAARKADDARRQAERMHDAAVIELERANQGGDAEDRLAQESLRTRIARADLERQRAHETVQEIEAAQKIARAVADVQRRLEAITADASAAKARQREAEEARRHTESERRLFESALALCRLREAEARRDEAEAAARRAETRRQEADALAERARDALAAIDAAGLPDPDAMTELVQLDADRRVAAARLGGGLSVAIALREGTDLTLQRDEGPATHQRVVAPLRTSAERRIALALPDLGEIVITAGDPAAREAADAIERRWADTAIAMFERAGVADLAALTAAMHDARAQREAAASDRAAADALLRQAEDDDARAADRDRWDRIVQERAAALAAIDRDVLAARAELAGIDEDALRRRLAESEARIAEHNAIAEKAGRDLAAREAERQACAREHEGAVTAFDEARRQLGGDPDTLLPAALDRLAAIEGEIEQATEELERRRDAGRAVRDELAAKVDRAAIALHEATTIEQKAHARLQAIDRDIERNRGAIAIAETEVARLDEASARAEVERLQAELRALPEPTATLDDADLACAEQTLAEAEATLRDVEAELHTAVGALQSVGGEVVRERAEEARQALTDARRQEHEVSLDYEGWRLLVQTLRETETSEGRHLGEALVDPIRRRFADLTKGRYGGLALGPDLDARGVTAAGGVRPVKDFSEGVQEQLATLLRVTIAEQLRSALVLDDHLTQTDPERIAWFRRLLRDASHHVQIIVLTCRPADYLDPDQFPAATAAIHDDDHAPLRAIDLTTVIRRAPTTIA